eukprot:477839_1
MKYRFFAFYSHVGSKKELVSDEKALQLSQNQIATIQKTIESSIPTGEVEFKDDAEETEPEKTNPKQHEINLESSQKTNTNKITICPCFFSHTLQNKDSLVIGTCCIYLVTIYISNVQKALPSSEGYYDIAQHVQPIIIQYFCRRPRGHDEFFTHIENDRKFQLQITGQHHNIVSLPPNPSNSKEPHKSFGFYKANFNQLEKCTVKWCFKIGLSNN